MGTPPMRSAESYQRLNAMVSQVQSRFIRAAPTMDVFAPLLVDLLGFTVSEYGFIADVLTDPADGHRFLRMQVLTDISWNDETRRMYQAHHGGERAIEFHNLDSLLGAAVTAGAPVIANDPAHDARRGGLPHQHPPLSSYLGVPLFHGGELIGLVGLSNRPGGYDTDLLDFLQPLFASVGAIIGAVHSEVARLQAEAALRQSEFEMRCTFEMAAVGMAHLAIDSRMLRVNQQLCLSLGCDEVQLLGRTLFELIHAEDRPVLVEHMAALINTRASRVTQELRGLHAQGEPLWWLFSATLVPPVSGKAGFVIAVLEDITLRKLNESRLLAAEAAQRANEARTRFLSHVSHELRTPLNAVVGFSQLLQLDRVQPLTEAQRLQVRHIETAGSHLLAMINDMIDLSGIENGMVSLSFDSTDLRQVLDEAVSMLKRLADEAEVRIEVEQAPAEAARCACWADRLRLRQVLINVLSHAIKHHRRQGCIGLACRPGDEAGTVELRLHDTDGGLTADQLEQLFGPFQRLCSGDAGIEGIGLGLRIGHRLMQLMGGRISIGSGDNPHGGHRVVLVLQAGQAHEPLAADSSPQAPVPQRSAAPPRTLLYVDDKPMNIELLAGVLRLRPQWRLLAAHNGQAAVSMATAQPLDLILLDLHLGDMSGLELLRQLRQQPPLAAVPCLMLSADALQASQVRAAQAGISAYLTKPLDVPRLLQMLDSVAER